MEEVNQNQPSMVSPADNEQQERMRRDVQEFVSEFPDVKPTDIDAAVWQEVRGGKSLVSAYRGHREQKLRQENQQLREQLQTEQRNSRNRQTTIGSQRTDGQSAGKDSFLDALLSD